MKRQPQDSTTSGEPTGNEAPSTESDINERLTETDDIRDIDDLSFEDEEPPTRAGDELPRSQVEREQPPKKVRKAGLTGAAVPEDNATEDDLSPDTLLNDDGARSPEEAGDGPPMDRRLTEVDAGDIGGGEGLDEAELARVKPLDGKPWDGSGRK